jgi:hypothetical protein
MNEKYCTCDSPEDSAGLHHRDWCGEPITGPQTPPRERWQFLGRETHYGFDYLVYVLVENPRGRNYLGKRWARVI